MLVNPSLRAVEDAGSRLMGNDMITQCLAAPLITKAEQMVKPY